MAPQARRLDTIFGEDQGDDKEVDRVTKLADVELAFQEECKNAAIYEEKAKRVEDLIQTASRDIDAAYEQREDSPQESV